MRARASPTTGSSTWWIALWKSTGSPAPTSPRRTAGGTSRWSASPLRARSRRSVFRLRRTPDRDPARSAARPCDPLATESADDPPGFGAAAGHHPAPASSGLLCCRRAAGTGRRRAPRRGRGHVAALRPARQGSALCRGRHPRVLDRRSRRGRGRSLSRARTARLPAHRPRRPRRAAHAARVSRHAARRRRRPRLIALRDPGTPTELGRKIAPTIYSSKEFTARVKQSNAFVKRVLAQPKLWLIGNDSDLAT